MKRAREEDSPFPLLERIQGILALHPPAPSLSMDAIKVFQANTPRDMVKTWRSQLGRVVPSFPGCPHLPSDGDLTRLAHCLFQLDPKTAQDEPVAEVRSPHSGMDTYALSFLRFFDPALWIDDVLRNAIGALLERQLFMVREKRFFYLRSDFWLGRTLQNVDGLVRDAASYRMVLSPVNTGHYHWVLLVASPVRRSCYLVDSFHGKWRTYVKENPILGEKHRELLALLQQAYPGEKPWSEAVPTLETYPTQADGTSCGMYVMHAMNCLATRNFARAFEERTWDAMRLLLRLYYARAVLEGYLPGLYV